MKHVIVIGAGIVGVSTTLWLQRYGCKVTLIDRQISKQAASYGNAGILAACSIIPVTVPGLIAKAPKMLFSPEQPLFLRWSYLFTLLPWLRQYLAHCNQDDVERIAKALMPLIGDSLHHHQALAQGTPAAAFVKPDDYSFLYDSRAAYTADAMAWQLREAYGFSWDVLEGDAVTAYDPNLNGGGQVLVRMHHHGRIPKPGDYVQALTQHALAQGATLIRGEVAEFIKRGECISGVKTADQQSFSADAVAVTTGVWSPGLTRQLGIRVPVESERGYHIELINPNIMPRAPIMVASGKFVMTPMGDRLRLAGIVEFGGLEAEASSAPHTLLRKKVRETLPGIQWEDETSWLGHRPAPVDSIPLIGQIDHLPGLYTGFGHHHIGLTGGPRTGQLLAQLISGQEPAVDLQPYRPDRFNNRE